MIYAIAKRLIAVGLWPRFRLRVEGTEHVPRKGAGIVASNHVSALDPPIVGLAVPRIVHFMGKAELFESFWLGTLMRAIHVFPVRRGMGDRQAIRRSLSVLEQGELLGIFPEGTRSKQDEVQQLHGGAAMLALKSSAPIIPVAVVGTGVEPLQGSGARRLVVVRIGRPIPPRPVEAGGRRRGKVQKKVQKEEIEKLSARLGESISALRSAPHTPS